MNKSDLAELVREIMSQGYDEPTASEYAALIGDTPILDDSGNVLVQDLRGNFLARLKPMKVI